MKKIFKNFFVPIISLVLGVAIYTYDYFFYWPSLLKWLEGNIWCVIIPLVIIFALGVCFPFFDQNKRSLDQAFRDLLNDLFKNKRPIGQVFKALMSSFLKNRKIFIISGGLISVISLLTYFGFFFEWKKEASVVPKVVRAKAPQYDDEPERHVEKPEVIPAPVFYSNEASPFEPDIVLITKSLSDLPSDIVKKSFLGKIITKETMFYYEDDPQYLGIEGILRRLSYEHNVELKDNILKYILSMSAEIALWKGTDGKIKDFLFIADEESLNKSILSFYLKMKQFSSDSTIRTFTYEEKEGYYIKVGKQEIAIWNHENKLYITNLHPKYFPDGNEEKLKEVISKTVGVDNGIGFYKRLYNVDFKDKHSIILNSEYLSFGYNYFIPSLKAVRLDYKDTNWSIQTLLMGDEKFKGTSTTDLWKAFPKSMAMCVGLPLDSDRIYGIIKKYKELTFKRLNEEEKTTTEKALFSDSEIASLVQNVVAACWYEKSSIYTPLFITKTSAAKDKKLKIKFLFDNFIGALEKKYYQTKITERVENEITVFSRDISSTYGLLKSSKSKEYRLKFDKFFNAKLAYNDEYIIFSPDGSLVELAISTLKNKNPSVYDELKISNKNLSYLMSPFALSQLFDKFMKKALPKNQESVFRNAVEGHLSSAFKNLKQIRSFGVDMPKASEDKIMTWQKIEVHDL